MDPTNNNDTDGVEADLTSFYSSSNNIDILPTDFADEDDTEAPPPAGGGVWNRKNKLLLSLIATSAVLCAAGAGGGVAARKARMVNANAANGCVAAVPATWEFDSAPTPGPKSTKQPSVKSSKQPSVKSSSKSSGTAPKRMLTGEMVVPKVHDDVAATTPQQGLAYPVIPKTVEHKRKNRVLAAQLGQKETSINNWFKKNINLGGGFFGDMGFFRKGHDEVVQGGRREEEEHGVVRRLSSTKGPTTKSSKMPSVNKSTSKQPTTKSNKSGSDAKKLEVSYILLSRVCVCVLIIV